MKVCRYCGASNEDSAPECASCGAKDFRMVCPNCGSLFTEGLYCSKCGVKFGTKAKKCPVCGKEYFSRACPDCGYVAGTKSTAGTDNFANKTNVTETRVYRSSYSAPARKRKTWLWVLGWIFIFPIPATILLVRNDRMRIVVKVILILLLWAVYLAIGLSADKTNAACLPSTTVYAAEGVRTGVLHTAV